MTSRELAPFAIGLCVAALAVSGCFVPRDGTRQVRSDGGVDAAARDAGPGDRDGDGVPDDVDVCPDVADPDQTDLDEDGIGDACDADRDGDGVPDRSDVCPDVPDPAQRDVDGDDVGDECDPDKDGDGIPNARDLCPVRSPSTPDEDGDGIADECDACPLDPDPGQENADGDRLGDACEDPDPTRFFRVAYLETFRGGLGDFVSPGGGFVAMDGAAVATATDEQTLIRPLDPAFMGQRYAVHVVGRYLGPEGPAPAAGSFGVLLRWTVRDAARFGYGMEVLAADDGVLLTRHDGGGCGLAMDEECVVTLIDRALGLRVSPDDTFVLRATGYDDELSLAVTTDASVTTHGVRDVRHAVGGFGLRAREAQVRFDAVAVYTP